MSDQNDDPTVAFILSNGLEGKVARATGLSETVVRRMLGSASRGTRARNIFSDRWPTNYSANKIKRDDMVRHVSDVTGRSVAEIREILARVNGNTLVKNALRDAPDLPRSRKARAPEELERSNRPTSNAGNRPGESLGISSERIEYIRVAEPNKAVKLLDAAEVMGRVFVRGFGRGTRLAVGSMSWNYETWARALRRPLPRQKADEDELEEEDEDELEEEDWEFVQSRRNPSEWKEFQDEFHRHLMREYAAGNDMFEVAPEYRGENIISGVLSRLRSEDRYTGRPDLMVLRRGRPHHIFECKAVASVSSSYVLQALGYAIAFKAPAVIVCQKRTEISNRSLELAEAVKVSVLEFG